MTGSFVEYGSLAIAAQRRRRKVDDLIKNTPADGLIAGVATVNAEKFGAHDARCMVISYDYTVLAGTQGHMNHKKIDRMLGLAEQWRMPLVFYGEGGGGRPGDTDRLGMTGLDGPSFVQFAKLSGLVPVVGVVSGYCFAGNAAMLGCCDVIIATQNASIGMGGPAMIEGGGLGVYHPAEVGPVSFQAPNGVIDILVEDEEEATSAAQKYLSYFQGSVAAWKAGDQRLLRRAIPENRLRVYDIRTVIDLLADEGSVLEIRRDFGVGMITAFIRIEGRPFGLIANNPKHLGGAIDAPAGDKAARFLQLCDAFDIPIVSLCDTPGFMVGPEAEKTAIVRHVARMFVTGASLTVPLFGIVLRKGYGLGAQSMIGGGFHASFFTVAWPTGEFGGMGLEGYVRLGFRKEMEAIADPGRAGEILSGQGRGTLCQRQGDLDRIGARDRRSDRPGRDPPLDHGRSPVGPEARAAQPPQAALHRCLVGCRASRSPDGAERDPVNADSPAISQTLHPGCGLTAATPSSSLRTQGSIAHRSSSWRRARIHLVASAQPDGDPVVRKATRTSF